MKFDCKVRRSVEKKILKIYQSVAKKNNDFFQSHGGGIGNFMNLSQDEPRNSSIGRGKIL